MTLTWLCNYCPLVFPHFKALIEHYKSCHESVVRRFPITNKAKRAVAIVYASSFEEACKFLDWDSKTCKLEELPR